MSEDKPKRFRIPKPGVLLVVGLVLSVFVVGLIVWVPYHREQVAIWEIERLGGEVRTEKGGPVWLRDLVGDEWMRGFEHAKFVVSYQPISDDDLIHLSGLTKLQWLILSGPQVTDDGLNHFSGLTELRILQLVDTQVTEDGVESLRQKLPKCTILREASDFEESFPPQGGYERQPPKDTMKLHRR